MTEFEGLSREELIEIILELQRYKDTTHGLWCIDKHPKYVSKQWIEENAFRIPVKEETIE